MPWYAWLLIGALSLGVIILVIVLLTRKKTVTGLSDSEKQKLLDAETSKLNAELQIEKDKQEKLKTLFKEQQERLAQLERWYDEAKGVIIADKREDLEKYLTDTKLAGAELDKLLGIGSGEG